MGRVGRFKEQELHQCFASGAFLLGVPFGTAARKQVAGQMTVSNSMASGSWKPVEMLGGLRLWVLPGGGAVVNQVEPGHSAPTGGTDEYGQETPPPHPPVTQEAVSQGDAASPAALGQPPGSPVSLSLPLPICTMGLMNSVSGLQWSAESCRHGLGPGETPSNQTGLWGWPSGGCPSVKSPTLLTCPGH